MNLPYPIQLPDDVQSVGYREVRPYQFEQVFHSPLLGFTGTAVEFVKYGYGYHYIQVDRFTRRIVSSVN